jgi:hypothetical protein
MSKCTSADIALYENATIFQAITTCTESSDSIAGVVIESCMKESGFSTYCSACWGNFSDATTRCVFGKCFSLTGDVATSSYYSQPCIDCLNELTALLDSFPKNTLCGIEPREESGMSVSDVKQTIQNILASVSSTKGVSAATPISFRSITISVILFALILSTL